MLTISSCVDAQTPNINTIEGQTCKQHRRRCKEKDRETKNIIKCDENDTFKAQKKRSILYNWYA